MHKKDTLTETADTSKKVQQNRQQASPPGGPPPPPTPFNLFKRKSKKDTTKKQ
ncbi:MAG: hypothetical protein JWP37_2424 [Mucilaginibacter sp.]|nr:hypothetical protein [Mucilaginibacter sp.]